MINKQAFAAGALGLLEAVAWASEAQALRPAEPQAHASPHETQCGESEEKAKKARHSRLKPHEPSFVTYGRSEGDEAAFRVRYSLRYELRPDFVRPDCSEPDWAFYLKYTGLFDFYSTTRPSGPVINRLSNIGLHWRYQLEQLYSLGAWKGQWYDIGLEHRSNGQTKDMHSDADFQDAQSAYQRGDHRFFDGISRGSNYLSLETRARHSDLPLSLYLKTKFYLSRDHAVRWGPQAQQGLNINDFDRLTIGLTHAFGSEGLNNSRWVRFGDGETSLYWTVGDKGPRHSSLDLDHMRILRIVPWEISVPFYVRLHWGPMNNLSNYSVRQTYIGAGLKFSPWW